MTRPLSREELARMVEHFEPEDESPAAIHGVGVILGAFAWIAIAVAIWRAFA